MGGLWGGWVRECVLLICVGGVLCAGTAGGLRSRAWGGVLN